MTCTKCNTEFKENCCYSDFENDCDWFCHPVGMIK